ncbi:3-isopropylmalate/(R)-2-methylmalate dehydratase small subunit [Candidatus Gastranaerophilus sp. (ex Termes propinquus)]|nr:3-isopropylmalate/(R)-2-methylmalate dehydratase small subunit [Candidatus Gastranaerophilus sp. (ex Termes propinquus)]
MGNLSQGHAFVYKDDVDTDVIIPARYLNTFDEKELAKHCMEDIDSGFASSVKPGDFIVAGENFGCGSSREHAPIAIKASGVRAVVAKSFARIFFRNAINIGLMIIENADLPDECEKNDELVLDPERGVIKNLRTQKEYTYPPYPKEIQELIDAGGLVAHTKKKLGV